MTGINKLAGIIWSDSDLDSEPIQIRTRSKMDINTAKSQSITQCVMIAAHAQKQNEVVAAAVYTVDGNRRAPILRVSGPSWYQVPSSSRRSSPCSPTGVSP